MTIRLPQNPGIGGLDELTSLEESLVQQLAALGDPNTDRILFWDDSAGGFRYLSLGSGLSITDTTLDATASGGTWGTIGGTLSDQTDLQTALNAKQNTITFGTGVLAALGVNIGVAGAPVLFNGALGTPSSGNLTNCTFPTLNQNTTGSAASLTTTRTIWGQNFNGTANVTGTLALGTADLTLTGSIGVTGARATKVWTTDIESTNMPTVGGVAILTSLTAPQFTTIELGHATDTTLSRVSAGVVAIEGVNILTTAGGTLTGSLTLGENTGIALDPAGSADGKWSGITITGTAGYTQAFGDLVYLDPTDNRWEAADANSAAAADGDSRGMLAMVVSAGTDGTSCTLLLQGTIRADAKFPTMTVNVPMYVSETAGSIVETRPSTSGVVIRVVGFSLTADEIYFNPSPSYITQA